MQTFQIQRKPRGTAQTGIKTQRRQSRRHGDDQIDGRKCQAKQDVAHITHDARTEGIAEQKKHIEHRAAQRTAANGNQKNIDLIAMIHRKMAAIPFAPAPKRTLDTSPAAEKAPLPSEKERTRNFAPSIFSRRPLISKTIARSVNVSTEATPVTEIFPSPMVSTLGTAGFCMVYCMPPYKKNSA